ncbi:MAG: preprotein translocase subunit YajC [Paraprevotella sp.]|jgi:preprotein translocase subunit YajC|nr:preprotein translocase subunit YajC [Paraprevotella sp.]
MNLLTILLQAQQGGGLSMIIMMVLIFVIMYFFMIRPQNKKQKEIQNFRNSIAPGTDVVTAGGIYGKVKEVNDMDNTLMVEVASGVKIKVAKNSVYASVPVDPATGK